MKILFIDDEENILKALQRNLKGKTDEWEMFFTTDSQNAIFKILEIKPDLVVTDARMPVVNGAQIVREMAEYEESRNIPAIMLTGYAEEELRQEAFEAGIIEFINKPVFPTELILRIENVLKLKRMINELKEANKKLTEYSNTDPLTGVYNRRYMYDTLQKNILIYRRYLRKFLICMFDIDNFKKINDNDGHLEGDRVLKEVAEKMKNGLRETDIICRYGGDEFFIIMPETERNEAEKIKTRIMKIIENIRYREQQISISGGIAECNGEEIHMLIKKADNLIYKVKREGKNNIIVDTN